VTCSETYGKPCPYHTHICSIRGHNPDCSYFVFCAYIQECMSGWASVKHSEKYSFNTLAFLHSCSSTISDQGGSSVYFRSLSFHKLLLGLKVSPFLHCNSCTVLLHWSLYSLNNEGRLLVCPAGSNSWLHFLSRFDINLVLCRVVFGIHSPYTSCHLAIANLSLKLLHSRESPVSCID